MIKEILWDTVNKNTINAVGSFLQTLTNIRTERNLRAHVVQSSFTEGETKAQRGQMSFRLHSKMLSII